MNLIEEAAYLKGLAEGLEVEKESKKGKLTMGMIELMGDLAKAVTSLKEKCANLEDYIEEVDEDLGDLAAVHTLRNSGTVYGLDPTETTEPSLAAIYRW